VNRIAKRSPEPNPTSDSPNISGPDRPGIAKDPYEELRGSLGRTVKHTFLPPRVSGEYSRYLSRIAAVCKHAALRCVFLNQPTAYSKETLAKTPQAFWMTPFLEDYTVTPESMLFLQNLYNQHLLKHAQENGFAALDLAAKIEPAFLNFVDDVHFTERGAENVSAAVADFLVSHVLSPGEKNKL
jgi:hypothetical protein